MRETLPQPRAAAWLSDQPGPRPATSCGRTATAMESQTEKPGWVDALEESLLLAIVLFSLITWIVLIGLLGH